MDAYDLSYKLAYAGKLSPVPFRTGPEFTNSVPGVPVLSMLRIFLEPDQWSEENVMTVAREVARVMGPLEQYDVGITRTHNTYAPDVPASGNVARLIKLDRDVPRVVLLIDDGNGDRAYEARYPRLEFERSGETFWQSIYDASAVKLPSQP